MSDEQTDLTRALKLVEWLDAERKNDKALVSELGRQIEVLSMQLREQGALLRQFQENLDQTTSLARKNLRLEEALKQARDHIELLQQRMDQQEKMVSQAARLRDVEEERQHKAFNELRQQVLNLEQEFKESRVGQFQEAKLEAARQSLVQQEQRIAGLEHDGESMAARALLLEEITPRLAQQVKTIDLRMSEVERAEGARQAQFKVVEERSRRSTEAATVAQKLVEETLDQSKAILARTKLVEEQGRRAEAQVARIEALETWRVEQRRVWERWEERGLDWTNQDIAMQEQMADRRRHDEKQDLQWQQFMDQYKLHRDETAQAREQEREDRRAQDLDILRGIDKWRAQVQEEFVETRQQFTERINREHQLWTGWLHHEMDGRGRDMAQEQEHLAGMKDLLRAAKEEKPLERAPQDGDSA
ncbi:MAG: hypothetical protein KKB13_18040 [Chloroflexi bacterium]|nr:hypothetical protein [Chloroflexota bacterium]